MRIAIFFSGRVGDRNLVELLKIKQYYKEVVFFMSVNEIAQTQKELETVKNILNMCDLQINVEKMEYPEYIYKLKSRKESNPERVYSMFYHNFKAFLLIQNYQKKMECDFDIIMKYRDDIIPKADNIIHIFSKMKDENKLYIPICYQYCGINDQIAIGNNRVMEKYSSAFKMFKQYTQENDEFILNPEIILKYHIKKVGIDVEKIKFSYTLQKKISK